MRFLKQIASSYKMIMVLIAVTGVILYFLTVAVSCLFFPVDPATSSIYSPWMLGSLMLIESGISLESVKALETSQMRDVLLIASFAFWFSFALLLAIFQSVLTDTFNKLRDDVRNGKVHYKFNKQQGNIIFLGWDMSNLACLQACLKDRPAKDVVIITEQPVAPLDDYFATRFPGDHKRIYLIAAKPYSEESFRDLNLPQAQKVYICGNTDNNQQDSENLRIFNLLVKLLATEPLPKTALKDRLVCYLQIADLYNFNKYKDMTLLTSEQQKVIDLRLWNFHDSWARQTWSLVIPERFALAAPSAPGETQYLPTYRPLRFRRNPEANHFELHILHFDQMAQALALQAIRLTIGTGNKIVLWGQDEQRLDFERFRAFYHLDRIEGVTLTFSSQSMHSCQEEITSALTDPAASVTLIMNAPCANNAIAQFSSLPQTWLRENFRVLIRQSLGIDELPDPRMLQFNSALELNFFGMQDGLQSSDFHEELTKRGNPDDNDWRKLSPTMQWSNRYVTDTVLERINHLGYQVLYAAPGYCSPPPQPSEEEWQEVLARTPGCRLIQDEHQRWVNERHLAGWEFNASRNDILRRHNCLVNYDQLPLKEQLKDEEQIRKSILSLKGQPMAIVPHYGPADAVKRQYLLACIGRRNLKLVDMDSWVRASSGIFENIVSRLRQLQDEQLKAGRTVIMTNSLAIGADELFYWAAREVRMPVYGILPMRPERYRNAFETAQEQLDFDQRLRGCDHYWVAPDTAAPDCYRAAADAIRTHCDSLWVITELTKSDLHDAPAAAPAVGGTEDTLRRCLEQVAVPDFDIALPKRSKTAIKLVHKLTNEDIAQG